jgi:hypothetical protein
MDDKQIAEILSNKDTDQDQKKEQIAKAEDASRIEFPEEDATSELMMMFSK